ncbi:hypothetical protein [Dactylosporangium salmoneum]|uniref:Uncharacterized protein n=1 Tax=Dactylosporangium salmoneum TaxID=53361 RepID=A0ABP5U1Q8_9ACTN
MSTKRKGAPRPGIRPAPQIAPGGPDLATAGLTADSTTGPAPAGPASNSATGPASNSATGPASNKANGPASNGSVSNDPEPAGIAFNVGGQGASSTTGGLEGGDAGGVAKLNDDAGRRSMSPAVEQLLDVGIKVAGLVIATLLAIVLALFEAFYSPLRIGGVRVPVSLVLALATNPLLGWFAFTTSRLRLAALLPAAAWCVIWFVAAGKTSEGDLVITGDNWVGLLTLFAGPLAFAIGIYVSSMRQRLSAGPRSGPGAGPSTTSPTAGV